MGCGTGAAGNPRVTHENVVISSKKNINSEYNSFTTLSEDSFMRLLGCKKITTGEGRVARIIKKKKGEEGKKLDEQVRQGLNTLIKLDSPHIMKIYEYFEDDEQYYIICEALEGGNLFDFIGERSYNEDSEKESAAIIKQLLETINYCFHMGIVNGNLGFTNVIFSDKDCKNIKIADFGFNKLFQLESKSTEKLMLKEYVKAPEIIAGKEATHKSDVWSVGIIAFALNGRCLPFEDEDPSSVKEVQDIITLRTIGIKQMESWKHCSEEGKKLVAEMLEKRIEVRPTAEQLLKNPYFVKVPQITIVPSSVKEDVDRFLKMKNMNLLQQSILAFLAHHADSNLEHKRLTKQFEKMDNNGDQVLSKEEIMAGYKEAGIIVLDKELEYLIHRLDTNGNGKINYSAFIEGFMNINKILNDKIVKDAFKSFDKDGNGTLDKSEIQGIIKGIEISGRSLDEIFKEIDKNQDNVISFSEFEQMLATLSESRK